jgi:hypothetical protein
MREANGNDEEAQCGFWGEGPKAFHDSDWDSDSDSDSEAEEEERSEGCAWHWFDVVGLICYALLILVVMLNLDIFLSKPASGTGMMGWRTQTTLPTDHEVSHCSSSKTWGFQS